MSVLAAFILALLFTFIFVAFKKDSFTPLVIFFLVLFLAGIATPLWIVPFGPIVGGVSWLPMLVFILLVALLLASPPPGRAVRQSDNSEDSVIGGISSFVWLLVCILLIAVIAGAIYNKVV